MDKTRRLQDTSRAVWCALRESAASLEMAMPGRFSRARRPPSCATSRWECRLPRIVPRGIARTPRCDRPQPAGSGPRRKLEPAKKLHYRQMESCLRHPLYRVLVFPWLIARNLRRQMAHAFTIAAGDGAGKLTPRRACGRGMHGTSETLILRISRPAAAVFPAFRALRRRPCCDCDNLSAGKSRARKCACPPGT